MLFPAAQFFVVLATLPQAASAVRPHDTVSVTTAARADRSPIIDGKDDDAVWRTARAVSEFRQFDPREDAPPLFRTEFKIAYDARNLFVFVRAFDPHPDSLMHALTRRDVRGASDQIIVMIDSYNDHRTGYEFSVNPDGVKRDYAIYNDGNEDDAWNAVWDVETTVDSLGWTAEFRIPLSQLRYADSPTHTFGLGVWRDIERYKQRVSWPLFRPTRNGLSSQLGQVVGVDNIVSPHRLEVTPYSVAKNLSRAAGSGFERVQQATVGADLKYGVTSNMTLDATVNPDFGQVEADPAVLNLSAFETFLSERRPFFVEGTGLYKFDVNCSIVNCNSEGLFYSRRIGRAPQLLDSYGDASSPTSTSILAATKLTGRLHNGLSLGVLDAVTNRAVGAQRRTIEPTSNYAVVRLQQDLRGGESNLGLIATSVDRALDSWTQDSLRRGAHVVGADFRHRFAGAKYEVSGSATTTRVDGSPAAIAETQRDPVHYYQRPDGALRFDSTRTSLGGDAEELLFGKYGGGITRFQTSYLRQSAGYEINDLGYLQRADQQSWSTWAALSIRSPRWFFKSAQINGNNWNKWTTNGLPLETGFNTNSHINLMNNWWVHFGGTVGQFGGVYCDRCTRGGPALRVSPGFSPWFGFNADDRWKIVPSLFFNFSRNDEGRSRYFNWNSNEDLRISTQLHASLGVSMTHNIDNSQWYGNFTDSAGATHYSFAHLDQHTISLTARATYTATPNLTVEVYAEPFVSNGKYSDVRQVSTTPRAKAYADRFDPYTPPADSRTGFEFRQLRSNTVVRWEYRPGSTLFAVWTHGRQFYENANFDRSWSDEYRQLFSLHPDNTFLIKLAYWINR
jgi:hypothetical protein